MRLGIPAGALFALMTAGVLHAADAPKPKLPVKVFILAGQSNMQGYGHVRTLKWLGEDPANKDLYTKLVGPTGPVTRPDVWIWSLRGAGKNKAGNLTTGYGVNDDNIGPELMFGHVLGDHFENQVLLVKTSWGGRSLAVEFRPPSAGEYPAPKEAKKVPGADVVGREYRAMIKETKDVLADLPKHFPEYKGQGFEISGVVWFQGWNDMINAANTAEYASNLRHFIKDIRKELGMPNLPFVIGEMGVGGKKANANVEKFRKAQQEGGSAPEFKGNVAVVRTADCWDEVTHAVLTEGWKNRKWLSKELQDKFEAMGSQPEYHYMGSAKIHVLMGKAFGDAMVEMLRAKPPTAN